MSGAGPGLIFPDWPAPAGVRAAFTLRTGGVSAAPYDSLNMGTALGDSPEAVAENRRRVSEALRLPSEPGWLEQVHGVHVVPLGGGGTGVSAGDDAGLVGAAGLGTTGAPTRLGGASAVPFADTVPKGGTSVVAAAGAVSKANASVVAAAGAVPKANASVVAAAGAVPKGDASVVAAAGAVPKGDASVVAGAGVVPKGDASVAWGPGRVCAIRVADCMPVLFAARDGSAVGAAHAGWRGLAGGVLEATVERLGVPASQLIAWMGPSIGQANFEVGDDVRTAFMATDPDAALAFVPNARRRWQCDLYALGRRRLEAMGVASVYGGGWCTFADSERFFSFRRNAQTGRMAALIWIES